MSRDEDHVTWGELRRELHAFRWEVRAWMLAIILGVLLRFEVPQTAAEALAALLS